MDTTISESIISSVEKEKLADIGRYWRWLTITGSLIVIAGIASIALPVASTIALTLNLATLLAITGVLILIQAIPLRHEHGSVLRFLQAVVSIVTGGLMFRYPGLGMLGVAIMLAFYLFTISSIQIILGASLRPHRGWLSGVISSLISFALGVCILLTFPTSTLWLPGFILGVSLIVTGSSMIGLSGSVRILYDDKNYFRQFPGEKVRSSPVRLQQPHNFL